MRIVAVADTHTFETKLGRIPDGDVFIHAGDLIRKGTLDELRGVADWIRALPHRHKIVVAGNHDWCFHRERAAACELLGPGVIYLEDERAVVDGVSFYGSPWQPEYLDWAYNLPRGAPLAEKWALIPSGVDVLITHGPPQGIGDGVESGDYMTGRNGCEDLRRAVARVQPLLHMFGHIHQDGGFWPVDGTAFANVTTWECARAPTVIDIDVAAKRVSPVTIPPKDPYSTAEPTNRQEPIAAGVVAGGPDAAAKAQRPWWKFW